MRPLQAAHGHAAFEFHIGRQQTRAVIAYTVVSVAAIACVLFIAAVLGTCGA